jgi:hypothetical protein
MHDGKDDLTGMRKNSGIPKFIEERDPTPLGDTVVLLGKMVVHYPYDRCMKTNDTYYLLSV